MRLEAEAAAGHPQAVSRIVIRPDSKRPLLHLGQLWEYREVLYALIRREIKIRYAQTVVGAGWVVLQPVLTTLVLNLLAGRWMRVATDGVPYPLFAYSGLVTWIYFTHVMTKSALCLVNTGLLSKAYFPRLLLPLAAVVGGLIDLFVAAGILALMMVYYRTPPGWSILMVPFCLLLLILVAFGIGLWLAVLNLHHRDFAHALPFATQLLFFMTPVAYPVNIVPPAWRLLYSLNPMVSVVACWRWTLFNKPLEISLEELAVSIAVGMLLLICGLWYFRREEPTLADVGEM